MKTPRIPKVGQLLRALRAVKINHPKGHIPIIQPGKTYEVKDVRSGCCAPIVDIGYTHHVRLKRICKSCKKEFRENTAMIPSHYFRYARKRSDALSLKLSSLEEEFFEA